MIDVGANVGYFSAVCAQFVGRLGSVHAIEANPSLFLRLQQVVSDIPDGPIRVHHFAIWRASCVIAFNVATNSGWSSLIQNDTFKTADIVEVPALTLDEFMQREKTKHVRVLKIDIEGAETDALLGSRTCLKDKVVDAILLEASPHRLKAFGRNGSDITDLMDEHGYVPVCCIDSERIIPVTEARRVPGAFNCDYLYVREQLYVDVLASVFEA